MPPTTPYSKFLGDREPVAAMRETAERVRTLTSAWQPAQFERSYAPGKWTARQIFAHLAHAELALGYRVRMALTTPNYVAQAFDQDPWIAREAAISGRDAVEAFLALNRFNASLFASLSAADRAIALSHPEYGALSVDWIIHATAGHEVNHLLQLEQIAAGGVHSAARS